MVNKNSDENIEVKKKEKIIKGQNTLYNNFATQIVQLILNCGML